MGYWPQMSMNACSNQVSEKPAKQWWKHNLSVSEQDTLYEDSLCQETDFP